MPEIGVDDPAENRRRLRIRIMRMLLRTLGPNHPKCQAFIKAEDRKVQRYNDAARRLNEVSGQHLISYKRNRYTGSMPLSPGGNK